LADALEERHGVHVLMCDPAGPKVATEQDAVDLVGATFGGAEVVVVPTERLDEQFFSLSTRVAGEIMQKFVNYRLRLAIVGDISRHLADSSAMRALVHESNNAQQVWFLPTIEALDERLKAESTRAR
jgi:hypothetical protein